MRSVIKSEERSGGGGVNNCAKRYVAKLNSSILLILSVMLFGLFGLENVFAEDDLDPEPEFEPTISITIPESVVVLELEPHDETPVFATEDFSVTVMTDNESGYKLSMQAESTDLTHAMITGGSGDSVPKIRTLAAANNGYTENTFTTNRWGYKLGDGNYMPFRLNQRLKKSKIATDPAGETTIVTFAAKADIYQPAGAYDLTVNFIAVANEPSNFDYDIEEEFDTGVVIPDDRFEFTDEDGIVFNSTTNTLYFELDLSNVSHVNENLLSIGTDIDVFRPQDNNGLNLHFYYPNVNDDMIIAMVWKTGGALQVGVTVNVSSTIMKIALNDNGLYYNGHLLLSADTVNAHLVKHYENTTGKSIAEATTDFFNAIMTDRTVWIGSTEGDNRSQATYENVIVFSELLTPEEMHDLTFVEESLRADFDVTDLLDPTNPIIPNQTFMLYNGDFNLSAQTLMVEMDVSGLVSNHENENLLSIGRKISGWNSNVAGDAHLHLYYTAGNRTMIIAPLVNDEGTQRQTQYQKVIDLIDGRYIKVAWGVNGLYINGELIFNGGAVGPGVEKKGGGNVGDAAWYLGKFHTPWLPSASNPTGVYTNVQIGSMQGVSQSNATYTRFEICDIDMTAFELMHYSGEHAGYGH